MVSWLLAGKYLDIIDDVHCQTRKLIQKAKYTNKKMDTKCRPLSIREWNIETMEDSLDS